MTAYGLFVEHYQKNQVIWNGQGGKDIFFQNEMPYDPPSQAAWMRARDRRLSRLEVGPEVTSFTGYGMGSYSSSTRASRSGIARPSRCRIPPACSFTTCSRFLRLRRHRARHQRHGRPGQHRQPGRAEQRGQLPLTRHSR